MCNFIYITHRSIPSFTLDLCTLALKCKLPPRQGFQLFFSLVFDHKMFHLKVTIIMNPKINK